MLRIWKGKELEGSDIGIMTLFVCADTCLCSNQVIKHLDNNPDIVRVYFGGGRIPFHGMEDWLNFLDYVEKHNLSIVIEHHLQTDYISVRKYLQNPFTTVIFALYDTITSCVPIQFKTDDYSVVTMYKPYSNTNLDTLGSNNLYLTDILLEEEH